MKNREKYPKTEDAQKAYEAHKMECKCNCTFSEWLDADEDAASEMASRLAGLVAGAIVAPMIIKSMLGDCNKACDKPQENANVGGDLGKCPVCGGENAKLQGVLIKHIACPDCGLYFGVGVGRGLKEHEDQLFANWRKLQKNVKNN